MTQKALSNGMILEEEGEDAATKAACYARFNSERQLVIIAGMMWIGSGSSPGGIWIGATTSTDNQL
jgi:hypothetical protein